MNSFSKYLFFFALGLFSFSSKSYSQQVSKDILNEYLWENCFETNTLKSSKTKTIRQTYFSKKPLKPIIKSDYKQKFWEINPEGAVTLQMKTIALSDTIIDTTVSWFFYNKNKLSTIKKTGIGGITVKSITYKNNIPVYYSYGKSINNSKKKTILDLISYTEGRKEFIETISIGKTNTLEKYKSSDSIVFKTIYTEKTDSNTTKTSTQFPLNSKEDFTVTEEKNNLNFHTICYYSKYSDSICYIIHWDEKGKIDEYETFNSSMNKKTHLTELIYDEKNELLKAIVTKNLENETIEIIKFHYTYYD